MIEDEIRANSRVETDVKDWEGHIPNSFLWSISIVALFWITFCWGFFDDFISSLGLNQFVFWVLACFAFAQLTESKRVYNDENWIWSLPVQVSALAYLFYDSYFIKSWSLLVIPVMGATLFCYSRVPNRSTIRWSTSYLFRLLTRPLLAFLGTLPAGISFLLLAGRRVPYRGGNTIRIVKGVLILGLLLLVVVVPLLSGADPEFAEYVANFYEQIRLILVEFDQFLGKTVVFLLLVGSALSLALVSGTFVRQPSPVERHEDDPIVVGIVIGGVLLAYLVFLVLQIKRLYLGELPIEFATVCSYVKTGFWQLMVLTMVNIFLVCLVEAQTDHRIRMLIRAFSVASLFMLASAALRMVLYVRYYGLSYEKFYASYAVVYCVVLLVVININLLRNLRLDTIKFGTFLFVIMYSFVSILPVDGIIVSANVSMSRFHNSRIALSELKALSPDVINLMNYHYQNDQIANLDMREWLEKRNAEMDKKSWYEASMLNHIYAFSK